MSAPIDEVRRLRIAVLNRSFVSTGGGAERYSIALVEQLAARHDVHVYAQKIEHNWPGVTYHRLWTPLTKPRWINQLWFAITSWWATRTGFDAVHSHENTWHGQVQTVHVLPVKYTLFRERTGFRLALRWIKVATSPRLLVYLLLEIVRYRPTPNRQIIVTSPSLRKIMMQTYPRTGSMLSVITPGVSRVSGLTSSAERNAAREALGLPTSGKCILFVANDYQKKGLPALLHALQLLSSESYLAIVGNAAQVPQFKGVVQQMGIASRVHFLGSIEAIENAYFAADCLAHPTLEDTFAMVVLEAMAHGLPVVVSNGVYCGIANLLTNKINALILENPNDHIQLAGLINQVLYDREQHRKLQVGGITFSKFFEWHELCMKQEDVYKRVVKAF